jgi:cytochrome P450
VGRFIRNIDALLMDYSSPHFLDFINAPKWIPRSGHARRDRIVRDVQAQLRSVVVARRQEIDLEIDLEINLETIEKIKTNEQAGDADDTGDKTSDRLKANDSDLLSLLLTAGQNEDEGTQLSDDQVIDNMITFLAAGHETSARSLAWTFYLLSQSPDWMGRVQTELAALDLDHVSPAEWQAHLPVLTAVLKESMRLYPAAGVISREAKRDDTLCGEAVSKGTLVSVAPWVLHRHAKLWENPDAFDPGRFMGNAAKGIPRFAYLPFGAGPRVCIGASFAMQEMIIILAVYLKRFTFTHSERVHPMPVMNLTIRPSTDLAMRVEVRE